MSIRNRETISETNINLSKSGSDGFLSLILKDYNYLLRAIIFVLVMLILIVGSIWFIEAEIIKKDFKSVEYSSENGNLKLILKDEKKTIYCINFSPSVLWKDSQCEYEKIEVTPDDSVSIRVSGRYNTAVHHLAEDALNHKQLTFPWCGPKGIAIKELNRAVDRYRIKYAIDTSNGYGSLLMQFVSKNKEPIDRPKGDNLIYIGDKKDIHYGTFKESGSLYFAVNEIPLFDNMKSIYVIPYEVDPAYYNFNKERVKKKEKEWDEIVKNKNWNIWYNDNIGSLTITIEIIKR